MMGKLFNLDYPTVKWQSAWVQSMAFLIVYFLT